MEKFGIEYVVTYVKLTKLKWKKPMIDLPESLKSVEFVDCNLFSLPSVPAVYFLCTKSRVLYIGCTRNLRSRILDHDKIRKFSLFRNITLFWEETTEGDFKKESELIRKYKPFLNYPRKVKIGKLQVLDYLFAFEK